MFAHNVDKFVNREKELALVKEKVVRVAKGDPFAPDERVVHFAGPSGIGKSCLLEKFYDIFTNDPKCIPILIKLEMFRTGHGEFVGEFLETVYKEFCTYQKIAIDKGFADPSKTLKKYSSVLLRTINLNILDKVLVILIDEINIPQKKELQGIEEFLLEKLILDERVFLITAGRIPAGFNVFALRPKLENTFVLPVFDENTTGEQLEKLMLESKHLAHEIRELGGGVPGNNEKLARHMVGNPPQVPNELQAVQSLLADLKDEIGERFHPIIESICVLPVFHPDDVAPLLETNPMLSGQWNESRIREVFAGLNKVQIRRGELIYWDQTKKSWVMDESTRTLFELELKMRNPELWRQLHCAAYQIYKKWGEEFNSQLYNNKAMYHQKCLQSAGMDCD